MDGSEGDIIGCIISATSVAILEIFLLLRAIRAALKSAPGYELSPSRLGVLLSILTLAPLRSVRSTL